MRHFFLTALFICGSTAIADPETELLNDTLAKVEQANNRLCDASYKLVDKRNGERGITLTEVTVIHQGPLTYMHGTRPVYVSRIPHVHGDAPVRQVEEKDLELFTETITSITNHNEAIVWAFRNQPNRTFDVYRFENAERDVLSERGESWIQTHRPTREISSYAAGAGGHAMSKLATILNPKTTPWHIYGPDDDGILQINVCHVNTIKPAYSAFVSTKQGYLVVRGESRDQTGEMSSYYVVTPKEINGAWYPSEIQDFECRNGDDELRRECSITDWVSHPNKPDSQFSLEALNLPEGTGVFHLSLDGKTKKYTCQQKQLVPDAKNRPRKP